VHISSQHLAVPAAPASTSQHQHQHQRQLAPRPSSSWIECVAFQSKSSVAGGGFFGGIFFASFSFDFFFVALVKPLSVRVTQKRDQKCISWFVRLKPTPIRQEDETTPSCI
jgi:hypothetical protein